MIDMAVLGRQMEMFTALIVIGIFLQKTRLISEADIKGLAALLTKLTIPCLMLTLMPNGSTAEDMAGMGPLAAVSLSYIAGMFIVSYLIAGLLKFPDQGTRQTHVLLCAAGNAGFIGVPLIAAVLPGEAAGSAVYTLFEAVICWTAGPFLLSFADKGSSGGHSAWKNLFSPITISVFAGFLITMLHIHPSGNVVWDTLTGIGGTTKYFSCVYIGLCVGEAGLRALLREKRVFLSSLLKLIIFPLVLYMILSRISAFDADKISLFLILGATPTAVSAPVLAYTFHGDMDYATSGVLINTMLSILTIPLVVSIAGML